MRTNLHHPLGLRSSYVVGSFQRRGARRVGCAKRSRLRACVLGANLGANRLALRRWWIGKTSTGYSQSKLCAFHWRLYAREPHRHRVPSRAEQVSLASSPVRRRRRARYLPTDHKSHRRTMTSHGHLLQPHEECSSTTRPIWKFPVYAGVTFGQCQHVPIVNSQGGACV